MIQKNIEEAKSGLQKIAGKASCKVKAIDIKNKLQLAYCEFGKAIFEAKYANGQDVPELQFAGYIEKITELIAAKEAQEDELNALNNKTKCVNCGKYSASDVPFCAFCGNKKIADVDFAEADEKVEEVPAPVEEAVAEEPAVKPKKSTTKKTSKKKAEKS